MTTTSSSNTANDDSRSCCSSKVYEDEKEETPDSDRRLPLAFNLSRHTEKILAPEVLTQTWRMKERVGLLFIQTIHSHVHNNLFNYLLYRFVWKSI